MIQFLLNGEQQQYQGSTLLADFITETQGESCNFAVAINENFIPKSNYASTEIKEGDNVELLTPMQGG